MKLPIIAMLTLCVVSCSTPPRVSHAPIKPVPRPTVEKHYLKPADIRRVRNPEFVKTYHVGRSVGGRRGSVMHEAHRVYRVEKANRWNLSRHQPPYASTGPTDKIVDTAFKPAPESKAIRAELNRQRELSTELEAASDSLTETIVQAKARLGGASTTASAIAALKSETARLRNENAKLRQQQSAISGPKTEEAPGDTLRQWGASLATPEEPTDAE